MSPRNFLFAFYFLWYTFSVMFATRFQHFEFNTNAEVMAYIYLISTYIVGYVTLFITENSTRRHSMLVFNLPKFVNAQVMNIICILIVLFSAFMMMVTSSGISEWIRNPGEAFLRREGAGVFTILVIFSSGLMATTGGYLAVKKKKNSLFFAYLALMILLIPFLGGKSRTIITILLMALPAFFFSKLWTKKLGAVIFTFLAVFGINTWLRSGSWITAEDLLPFFLNYFSTYEYLVQSINEIEPEAFKTVFMAFNKFKTPFGISNNEVFYDMSNWLTATYFPEIWKLRATEQWPIETDMWLSFRYWLGIPLLILYFSIIGRVYNVAMRSRTLGAVFVSAYLSFQMISHLRGQLIIWTDFYMIPFFIASFYLLNKFVIPQKSKA